MVQVAPGVMKCPEHKRGEALELLYRKVPSALRERLIVQMLAENERGELDLSGLWVAATRRGRIAGAMLTQPLVGKVAAVWAPEIRRIWRPEHLATEIIQTVITDFAARGFKLVQAVVDESAGPQASRDLEMGGLPRITEMLYLERSTSTPLDSGPMPSSRENRAGRGAAADSTLAAFSAPSPFMWHSFDEFPEPEFRRTLQETYTGSLDMPELEGARSFDEILAGYKSVGSFAPQRWRMGQIPDDPGAAAVLLLTEIPGRSVWEVLYLGLTPPARGRRLGRAVLEHAIELARAHVPWLELTVDVRNTPARRLYDSAGFMAYERRAVHLKVLPGVADSG
jgi:mycothiol synthase